MVPSLRIARMTMRMVGKYLCCGQGPSNRGFRELSGIRQDALYPFPSAAHPHPTPRPCLARPSPLPPSPIFFTSRRWL